MYCSNCGNQIYENDKFCRKCGKPVANNNNSEDDTAKYISNKENIVPIGNGMAWILAFFPAIYVAAYFIAYTIIDAMTPYYVVGDVLGVVLMIIILIVSCVLANSDKKKVFPQNAGDDGYLSTGELVITMLLLWVIMVPIYLYKRTKITGQTKSYFVVAIIVYALLVIYELMQFTL
ncbi:MAG: zinc-ribbon domain-containing protein [Clostridiales Family XIII bacterium]|jgi:small-conductance mechanosensitive channel|nr:zinc-ribbon domain-containing protein [Clostridiales Family XIII bacterium]